MPGIGVHRVLVRPTIVRLPRVVAALEDDVRLAAIAHDEHDVALPGVFVLGLGHRRELAEINSAGPVGGDFDFGVRLPAALAETLRPDGRFGLRLHRDRAELRHVPPAGAAVVTHPIYVDRGTARRFGAEEDAKRLAGFDALMRAIAFDQRRSKALPFIGADFRELPAIRPRARILALKGNGEGEGRL